MKNIFSLISFLGVFAVLNSCAKESTGFEISANVTGFSNNSKVTVSDATSGKILDSTRLTENSFRLKGHLEEPPNNLILSVVPDKGKFGAYSTIFIGNEKVSVEADSTEFRYGLKLTGSSFHNFKSRFDERINPLEKKRNQRLQEMFSLRQEGKWNDSLQTAFWGENGLITELDEQTLMETKDFIEQNTDSYYALYQLVLNKTVLSRTFINEQINKLSDDLKGTKYVRVLKAYQQSGPLEKNDRFYDFSAENQLGGTVKFSDFFDKKDYVLLEFYSPYCSWCTKALPEIKKLEESERNRLDVITFSVDRNKEDWLEDYRSKEKDWTSLWSAEGRYGDAFTTYGVHGTPTYFLFNKDGTLLNKWRGYDETTMDQIRSLIK
ncbi:TlpA disulfide reductase family protein [Pareuzebyella sediminis]|uniref:TlpA disulfide reductase family protein n=1 Tax=Pareuzebyella sediminis TaxID=2607998 RepID=UPI0011EF2945|nr:TlpA disulfide reductase family protein [Pareuzebyella sediminis]